MSHSSFALQFQEPQAAKRAASLAQTIAAPLSACLARCAAAFRRFRQDRLDRIVLCQMDERLLRDIGISPSGVYGRLGRRP